MLANACRAYSRTNSSTVSLLGKQSPEFGAITSEPLAQAVSLVSATANRTAVMFSGLMILPDAASQVYAHGTSFVRYGR